MRKDCLRCDEVDEVCFFGLTDVYMTPHGMVIPLCVAFDVAGNRKYTQKKDT